MNGLSTWPVSAHKSLVNLTPALYKTKGGFINFINFEVQSNCRMKINRATENTIKTKIKDHD
jgi:hypothetical protein